MRREYEVLYDTIEDGWIMASVPDLPGAVTQGETMEEARANIREVIELLLESYREHCWGCGRSMKRIDLIRHLRGVSMCPRPRRGKSFDLSQSRNRSVFRSAPASRDEIYSCARDLQPTWCAIPLIRKSLCKVFAH